MSEEPWTLIDSRGNEMPQTVKVVPLERYEELRHALRRIVEIGSGPPDRDMPPADHWLPILTTVVAIAQEALFPEVTSE